MLLNCMRWLQCCLVQVKDILHHDHACKAGPHCTEDWPDLLYALFSLDLAGLHFWELEPETHPC